MDELAEVSGGNIGDAIKYWGAPAALAQGVFGSGWASKIAVSALGVSPIAPPLVNSPSLTMSTLASLWNWIKSLTASVS
jgi:hypothetical protein